VVNSATTLTPDTVQAVSGVGAVTERTVHSSAVDYDTWLAERADQADPVARMAAHSAVARGGRGDYSRWLRHVWPAAGCSEPVRLAGRVRSVMVDTATGEIVDEGREVSTGEMPDGVIYKACGNRRASVCPSCAEVYRADAYQLVLAGLRGGKGVPETVAGHPAVFMTLTAPGFGIVHTQRTTKDGKPAPCRARRHPDPCPHGVDQRCHVKHQDGDQLLGQPLCPDCYDYDHHVVWNVYAAELWRRTTITTNRLLRRWARDHGHAIRIVEPVTGKSRGWWVPVRISFGKVAEFQRRGVVHFHVLARFDGVDPNDPDVVVRPPAWANAFLLGWLLRTAVEATRFQTRGLVHLDQRGRKLVDQPDGWLISWGSQVDIRPVRVRGDQALTDERVAAEVDHHGRPRMLSKNAVAGYLAKYATKATEVTGHTSRRLTPSTVGYYTTNTHPGRLIAACWRLGQRGLQTTSQWKASPYYRLRRWAHMLGYGGHFFTKSRRYSTTFRALRQARIDYRRAHHITAEHREEGRVLAVIGELVYAGSGWHTTGDALLANTAAALARERRQVAREEITCTG